MILPEFLNAIITQNLEIVEKWFGAQLYERMVKRFPRHLLVRLNARLDLSAIEADFREYQHQAGPGTKPTHSIRKYVRALLVKYLYNWSLRETEERLQNDLMVKWFVGYGVWEEVMDYSALCLFEEWVEQKHHRQLFDRVLRQIDTDFPKERGGVQIGDTYAMQANAALESVVERLRHMSRLLLAELEQGAREQYQSVMAQLDQSLLFGPANEHSSYWLDKEQRKLRQEKTVRGVWRLLECVKPLLAGLEETLRQQMEGRVTDLEKMVQDEFRLSYDPSGKLEEIAELDKDHKGAYRICSATDPDATCRNHGGDRTVGYNISLSITPDGVIREIAAATGAEPDQAGVAALIEEQRQHQGWCPDKLIYDQAAGAGRTRAEVAKASQGQTQLVARIPPASTAGRFGPQDFHLMPAETLVCPQQRTTSRHFRSSSCDGEIYEFSAKDCADCPLWSKCRDPKASSTGPRRVFLSDYQDEIHQAQIYNQSDAFKQDMKLRPRVERVISVLTHYDGSRRARSRGLERADFQAKMNAAARNLRTWLGLWEQKEFQSSASV